MKTDDTVYVTLCECKACGWRWTESHPGDLTWMGENCGKCGGESTTVRVPGTDDDATVKNRWCPGGVLMTWDEKKGMRYYEPLAYRCFDCGQWDVYMHNPATDANLDCHRLVVPGCSCGSNEHTTPTDLAGVLVTWQESPGRLPEIPMEVVTLATDPPSRRMRGAR